MKVGVTGSDGFIAWHLQCYLKTCDDVEEVRTANRATFANLALLRDFVGDLDCIVHLAGVNRAKPNELLEGNLQPAQDLVEALEATNTRPCVIYASSTYAESANSEYGKGKAEAGNILKKWADCAGTRLINMIIPHVFGEYGRPFYNSAMATFCYLIANKEEPSVNKDGQLALIHVQDLVEEFMQAYRNDVSGDVRIEGYHISVEGAADRLKILYDEYIKESRLPDLSDSITRCFFNALRGALSYDERLCVPVLHKDNRGWLVETVRAGSGGQCFVSTTKPGITRGNHFHRRKVERFFVLQGQAVVRIRKLFTDNVIEYHLDGNTPSFIDIPTLHTHNITNIGDTDLITLFWADEFFDPENPDTYFEEV